MEKLISFLIGLIWACAALVLIVIIVAIIHSKSMKKRATKLLSESDRGADTIYKLLRTAFPAGRIIKQAVFSLKNGGRAMSDLILVDSGGVFVIRIKTFPGRIDNSNRALWTVTNTKGVGEFPNPFEQNKYAVTAVNDLLQLESLYNVPTHNIVVFSHKKVAFKINSEKLLTAERLIDTIKDLNRNRFLTGKEINATIGAIKNHSTHK